MSRFKRTPFISTSMSDLSANEEIINREEINIECFDKSIDNWEIPRVQANQIYQKSMLKEIFYKTEYTIATEEKDVPIKTSSETINPIKPVILKQA